MKKTIILLGLFCLLPTVSYAEFNCVSGKYNSIIVAAPPSQLSDSRGTATVNKSSGVCFISLKTNRTSQEWEIKPNSLVHKWIDSMSRKVLDVDTATKSEDAYFIDCTEGNCEKRDADAYWKIFSQPRQGINPYTIVLLYYGHQMPDDPGSTIGLIDKFAIVDTK